MPKPTFLGIGAQRAGTTFLHTQLARHPQIVMPQRGTDAWGKEQHFFNRFVLSFDLGEYEAALADPDKPGAEIVGEITPAYAILPAAAVRTVSRYLEPEATRVVFLVRDPIDRVVSAYKQFHAIKNRFAGKSALGRTWRLIFYAERPGVIHRMDYLRTVENWSAVFGPDHVKVVSFEELTDQPIATLQSIARFLGADPNWFDAGHVSTERVYASANAAVPQLARAYVAWRWRATMQSFSRHFGGRFDHWVRAMDAELARTGRVKRVLFGAACRLARLRQRARRRRLELQWSAVERRLHELLRGRLA